MSSTSNSHINMLTDMLVHEKPDIHSDFKNSLLVFPTEVLGEEQ